MVNECQNCGNSVSDRFARVYGNDNGELFRCMDCSDNKVLRAGGGAIRSGQIMEERMKY